LARRVVSIAQRALRRRLRSQPVETLLFCT
jgi:hypothetical protein